MKILIIYRTTYGFTTYLTDYGIFDGSRIRQKDIAWFKQKCRKLNWTIALLVMVDPEFKIIALWQREIRPQLKLFHTTLARKEGAQRKERNLRRRKWDPRIEATI